VLLDQTDGDHPPELCSEDLRVAPRDIERFMILGGIGEIP
jgi:hypothetical protein